MGYYQNLLYKLNLAATNTSIDGITAYDFTLNQPVPSIIDFDYLNILDNPPLNSSNTTMKELKYLSNLTSNLSSQDLELIFNIDEDPKYYFYEILDKYNLQFPMEQFKTTYKIIKPALMNTKYYFNRPRPEILARIFDIKINIIKTPTINSPAYPSGHVVYSSLCECVLTDMYPNLSAQFNKVVDQTSLARMMQGVHYPSDGIASIVFTKFMYNKLKNKLRDKP
jgi:membrane-associated phospholipid phosphatase